MKKPSTLWKIISAVLAVAPVAVSCAWIVTSRNKVDKSTSASSDTVSEAVSVTQSKPEAESKPESVPESQPESAPESAPAAESKPETVETDPLYLLNHLTLQKTEQLSELSLQLDSRLRQSAIFSDRNCYDKQERKMKLKRLFMIFMASALTLTAAVPQTPAFAADNDIDKLIAEMTTEEKVAQMIMPSFRWYTDAEGNTHKVTELTDDVENTLEKYAFGGVALFRENLPDTERSLRLTDAMQKANAKGGANRPQLLISADQEGGTITRLTTGTSMCGNMALGAIGNTEYAKTSAVIFGEELKAVGINMDLAPVVDINNNAANPVIGIRSFSDDTQTVIDMGKAYLSGLQESGVISTIKHFPGHGNTDTDSHTGLPLVLSTYDELKKTELKPFQECIDAGADVVMTAHIQFLNIEKETYVSKSTGEKVNLPATLSKTIMTDILRGDMGFDGVVVTDAMLMDAIEENFDRLDAAKLAINAGVDMLGETVDTSTKEGIEALGKYVEDVAALVDAGDISVDKVNAAVKRILTLKKKYGLLNKYDGSELSEKLAYANDLLGCDEHRATEWDITKKAVTVVKNDNGLLPLGNQKGNTVIMTPYDDELLSATHAVGRLSDEKLIPEGSDVTSLSYENLTAEEMQEAAKNADNILVLSEMYDLGHIDPTIARGEPSAKIDSLIKYAHSNGKKVIILSVFLPYDAARYTEADAILLCYGAGIMSEDPRVTEDKVKFGANIPAGIYMAFTPNENVSGKLPVNIPVLDDNYAPTSEILYARGTGIKYSEAAAPNDSSIPDDSSDTESGESGNPPTGIKSPAILAILTVSVAIPVMITRRKK